MATKNPFPVDDLVKSLLQEENTPPTDVILIAGFLGEGKSEESLTIYLDVLLRQAIEIAKEDVLYSVKISKTHSPIGGTLVWLKNASKYLYGNAHQTAQDWQKAQQYFGGYGQQPYPTAIPTNPYNPHGACCK